MRFWIVLGSFWCAIWKSISSFWRPSWAKFGPKRVSKAIFIKHVHSYKMVCLPIRKCFFGSQDGTNTASDRPKTAPRRTRRAAFSPLQIVKEQLLRFEHRFGPIWASKMNAKGRHDSTFRGSGSHFLSNVMSFITCRRPKRHARGSQDPKAPTARPDRSQSVLRGPQSVPRTTPIGSQPAPGPRSKINGRLSLIQNINKVEYI